MNLEISVPEVSAAISAMALIWGVYQYRLGRVLDRAKFAAELVEKLYKDEDLATAWLFADFHSRDILLPGKYYMDDKNRTPFHHSAEKMQTAFSMKNRVYYGPDYGVRPCGWTVSSGSFDRLLGVLILELRWAEIAESGM